MDVLREKIRSLVVRGVCEACLAKDLPENLALHLVDNLEGTAPLLGWKTDGLVTLYLWADLHRVHEYVARQFCWYLRASAIAQLSNDSS